MKYCRECLVTMPQDELTSVELATHLYGLGDNTLESR
jgi:hypothetical protein